jgi:succinate dehydrogenase/fumarate reductase flavoprotein subunit
MTSKSKISRRDLLRGATATGAALATGIAVADAALAKSVGSIKWDHEADLVVVGAGASGFPAATLAREAGLSVILVEAENHIGGHAILSAGNVPLGGGTALQKKYGVEDSPDLLYQDLTDWSVTEPNGATDYRYNDREVIRAFADNNVATFDWLTAHGVVWVDKVPDILGGGGVGNSAPRENHAVIGHWPMAQSGVPADTALQTTAIEAYGGNGLMRSLEAAARKSDVKILLQHRMKSLHRLDGRVAGMAVENNGGRLNIRARKAVFLGTGGSTGNVNFRRMVDPRLTEEYCGLAGMPWSNQDASGELAAMAVGASLWGLANEIGEFGWTITKPEMLGCQYGYRTLQWLPGSEVFARARAAGLRIVNWQDAIMVNMLGRRFYDEAGPQFHGNDYKSVDPYTSGSYLNAKNVKFNPPNWLNAAMAGIGDGHNGGGAIWAIFDAESVKRERWNPEPPNVDIANGFFFQADSIVELARKIAMKYQRVPMPPENLQATVARYNSFIDSGTDADFGKPKPLYKIATPPFYAAWAVPCPHDTRAGLRINARCQVIDMEGQVIPGLYCGGESAGGFSQHGLARALVQGYIAGTWAAKEPPNA